jgi:hypothetical protein
MQSGIYDLHYEYSYKNQDGINLLKSYWPNYTNRIYKHGDELDRFADEQMQLPFSY